MVIATSDLQKFGPRVGTAIFIVRDGKFIFLKRQGSHGAGTWSTPGGHVEFGEDPVDTCIREAIEETGCTVDSVRFAAITNDFFPDDGKHYITLWYVGRWAGGEPIIKEPNKCSELIWTTFDNMPSPGLLTYNHITEAQKIRVKTMIKEIDNEI